MTPPTQEEEFNPNDPRDAAWLAYIERTGAEYSSEEEAGDAQDSFFSGYDAGIRIAQQEIERVKREYFEAGQTRFKVAERDGVPVLGMNVYDSVEQYEKVKQSKQAEGCEVVPYKIVAIKRNDCLIWETK